MTASPRHVLKLAASLGQAMRLIVSLKMERRFRVVVPSRREVSPAASSLLTSLKDVAREQ